MEILRFIVGGILPYVALAVFVGGMTHRVYTWKKLSSPPMTLFPAPWTESANAVNTLQEVVFFKSLFRGDRALWFMAWLFHVVLALIFAGHIRVLTDADQLLMGLGMSKDNVEAMSSGAGGVAGVVILATALLLLLRRIVVPRVREVTELSDCLALLLIGAIIVTGNMMRFGGEHFDLTLTRTYFAGLASFDGVTGAAVLENNVFLVHMFLAFLLIMFIPFSKILHFGGIFFTHQMIRKH